MPFNPMSSPCSFAIRRFVSQCAFGYLLLSGCLAQAQLVVPHQHAWQQLTAPAHTSVQLLPKADRSGTGLQANGRQLWPQWEGRIGMALDRPLNPEKNTFLLAQPAPGGLQLRSFHILSDYPLQGGFRATAGLLRGQTDQAWWTGSTQTGGVSLSLQRLDRLRLPGHAAQDDDHTMAYIGAGYSLLLNASDEDGSPSHFNADIGMTASGIKDRERHRISATDGLGGSPLGGKLKWSPLIKFSVDYAF